MGFSRTHRYLSFVVILSLFELTVISTLDLKIKNNDLWMLLLDTKRGKLQKTKQNSLVTTTTTTPNINNSFTGISNAYTGKREDIARLSPDILVASEGLQLDDETLVLVGGYCEDYNNVTRFIQFFNITNQQWRTTTTTTMRGEKIQKLPDPLAETHQGITYDPDTDMLYIVSGQKGAGCMGATRSSGRIHLKSGKFQMLPPLPKARYAPGTELITDPNDPFTKHLHVFGGASESRNQTALDHWRLVIHDNDTAATSVANQKWEILEPVPDAGTHGTSFVSSTGYIYYTGFCTLDPGRTQSPSMAECHLHATRDSKQLLHHVSDAGLVYRYPTAFALDKKKRSDIMGWERMKDMPFPLCHSGAVSSNDRLFLIGGGAATLQTSRGSAPTSFPFIQVFDANTNTWTVSTFKNQKRRSPLFLMAAWIDKSRQKLFSMQAGKSLVVADLITEGSAPMPKTANQSQVVDLQKTFLKYTRGLAVHTFKKCIEDETAAMLTGNTTILIQTLFDDNYNSVRGTWNRRHNHLQRPDAVTFPETAQQVQVIVTCSERTGYHVCGRNGKHSYDGSTCTYGIVVDVSRLDSFAIVNQSEGVVRLGAGLTLGQVTVHLQPHGFTLPMGSCSTVGITGLTLNGGQGPLSRLYGMTSDLLESVELVNSQGKAIVATIDNEYSDYLWLARGGGSVEHYPGIVTSLQFRGLPSIPQNKTIWTRVQIFYAASVENAVKLLRDWQDFFEDSENLRDPLFFRITAEPFLFLNFKRRTRRYDPTLFLNIYFFGDNNHHDDFVERFLPKLKNLGGKALSMSMGRFDNLAFQKKLGGVRTNEQLASRSQGYDLNQKWRGFSAVASAKVNDTAFQKLAEGIYLTKPFYRRYAELKPLGGAIRHSKTLPHRNSSWFLLVNHFYDSINVSDVDLVLQRNDIHHSHVQEAMGKSFSGKYAGYVEHSNSRSLDLKIHYGNNSERILQIKQYRDPHNLFRNFLPNTDGI